MTYETRSISFHEPIKARHPDTHKPIKLMGITDEETPNPKLVALVVDHLGKRVEVLDWADNEPG